MIITDNVTSYRYNISPVPRQAGLGHHQLIGLIIYKGNADYNGVSILESDLALLLGIRLI